jgi:hypothetical protein
MPQLEKGGKWVFGWTVVGPQRELTIPPEAQREYGFRVGSRIFFVRPSRRSGGLGIGAPGLADTPVKKRVLGQGRVGKGGQVILPPEVDVQPGDKLLAVRGSCFAVICIARGPIYQEALKHPELEVFGG